MPNHVTNKLLFHPCTEKRFNEILADLQKEGAEHGSIDLGRIIPEPEGLFMGDLGVEEMKKYKDNNWYDWRIKHWNTKWNAYGFEPPAFSGDTGTMTFRTANCSPFLVIFKLSQKYPDVEIDLRYADEDIGYNVGEITVCAGELIDDNSPQYGSATAQELAADILGLNLDFDLNTGSGYVISLLGNYYEYLFVFEAPIDTEHRYFACFGINLYDNLVLFQSVVDSIRSPSAFPIEGTDHNIRFVDHISIAGKKTPSVILFRSNYRLICCGQNIISALLICFLP